MRVFGITIPDQKHLEIGLTTLYGVGRSRAREILRTVKVSSTKKAADLSEAEEAAIRGLLEGMTLEGDLKRITAANIKRLKDIKAYRGTRHMRRLPARGQRTKTNSRTIRGNVRRTMGSGRKKVEKK
jgi:small subunit ribosomal protein S13